MTDPITQMFDMQRTAVKQTQKATTDAIEAQKAMADLFVDSMQSTGSIMEQNATLTKQSWHAIFDAMEANMPEGTVDFDQFRDLVDEQVDMTAESQEELVASFQEAMQEGSDAWKDYADSYTDVVDSSFDSFIEAHEEAQSNWSRASEQIEIAE
jgi:hypothetical protein